MNSGYRCKDLNDAVGGSKTSAHMIGYAVDLFPMNGEFERFAEFTQQYIRDQDFDQCILEKCGSSE